MSKKMKIRVVCLLVLSILLISCGGQPTLYTCPDGSQVTDSSLCPEEEVEEEAEGSEEGTVEESEEKAPEPTKQVKELLQKHENIDSYSFVYNSGTPNSFSVVVSDNKWKKVYSSGKNYQGDPNKKYTEVYMNKEDETAYAYCPFEDRHYCDKEASQKSYTLNYEEEKIELPLEAIKGISYAEKIGEVTYDNRKSSLLLYESDGKDIVLTVDNFWGVPLRKQVYSDYEAADIIKENAFTGMAVHSLAKDVDLPDDVQIVS